MKRDLTNHKKRIKINPWKVSECLERQGMKIEEVAEKIGYSKNTIYKRNKYGWRPKQAVEFANILGVSIEYLISFAKLTRTEGEESEESEKKVDSGNNSTV